MKDHAPPNACDFVEQIAELPFVWRKRTVEDRDSPIPRMIAQLPWLAELAGVTADAMSNAWPDISERSAAIQSSIAAEEERFATENKNKKTLRDRNLN